MRIMNARKAAVRLHTSGNKVYTVHLGESSSIKDGATTRITEASKNLLDQNRKEPRQVWVSFEGGKVRVGAGGEVGAKTEFMAAAIVGTVTKISINTIESTGEWLVCPSQV